MKLDINNIKPKGYMVSTNMKQYFPDNEIIYTIQVYTNGRIWSDWTYDIVSMLKISHTEFYDFMKTIYSDSKIINGILYFEDIIDCKNAIGNLENLIIMSKLTR